MTTFTGGSAFPFFKLADSYSWQSAEIHGGLTVRDHFSAMAMQSIRSGPEWQLLEMKDIAAENNEDLMDVIAHYAYKQADAMLKAREMSHD